MRSLKSQLLVLPCALLLFVAAAQAEVLHGKVVSVIDGDKLSVMDQQQHRHVVQLAGIDAPEPGQNFSKHARENLQRLVANREVVVRVFESASSHILIGSVIVHQADGDLDVGLAQIRAGVAWYNFENPLSDELRNTYFNAEREARKSAAGLWSDPQPIAPWEYQRRQRAETYYETVPG